MRPCCFKFTAENKPPKIGQFVSKKATGLIRSCVPVGYAFKLTSIVIYFARCFSIMWICFYFLLTLQSFKIKGHTIVTLPVYLYSPLLGFVVICNDAFACGCACNH